jgi:hypothetical protein
VITTGDQHFGQLGIQWEFGHDRAQICQVAVIVEGGQVVEQLEGSHKGFWCGRVHEIEMDQIVDAQLLQLQHDSAWEIRKTMNFYIIYLLKEV